MKISSQIRLGIGLILFGVFLAAKEKFPAVEQWANTNTAYPLNIILIAALIFILSMWSGLTSCASIATLVAGIGGILYYQKITGSSEPILWTLLPAFIGIGMIQSGLFSGNTREAKTGTQLMGFSALVFVICAIVFNKLQLLGGVYGLAIILIPIGLWYFMQGLRPKKDNQDNDV